jgi:hypothetical protein
MKDKCRMEFSRQINSLLKVAKLDSEPVPLSYMTVMYLISTPLYASICPL